MARDPIQLSDERLDLILTDLGIGQPARREVLWAWFLSRVERVHLADGATVVLKMAMPPFEMEARILRTLRGYGLPVPVVLRASSHGPDGMLVMILEDLGHPVREANLQDGAEAACLFHVVPPPAWLPYLGEGQLASLPTISTAHLTALADSGRWAACEEFGRLLTAARAVARRRVDGASLPPFGLCHSEFHPTSLHVGDAGWRLLDWARAFKGPCLLDLASWQGTQTAASPDACRELIDAYVAAGGAEEAAARRGGIPCERWALGWHRLWVVEWYMRQSVTLGPDPDDDPIYEDVVRRHLTEALSLLGA